jgi:hypothetical protein
MLKFLQFSDRGHGLFQGEVHGAASGAGHFMSLHGIRFAQGQPFQLGGFDNVAQ